MIEYYFKAEDAFNRGHDIEGEAEKYLRDFNRDSVIDDEIWSKDKRSLEKVRRALKKQGFRPGPIQQYVDTERSLYSSVARELLAVAKELTATYPSRYPLRLNSKWDGRIESISFFFYDRDQSPSSSIVRRWASKVKFKIEPEKKGDKIRISIKEPVTAAHASAMANSFIEQFSHYPIKAVIENIEHTWDWRTTID